MRLRFLGTGTSFGVPVVGCDCAACTSSDPRDRRSRHAALLEDAGRTVLVDTPPELRLQLIEARVAHLDAVWYTHDHADHTHGIDDLRAFSVHRRDHLPVFADPVTAAALRRKFSYIFDPAYRPPEGTTKPELQLREFQPDEVVDVAGLPFTPLPLLHGDMMVYGFRCGDLGYVTDAKFLSPEVQAALRGVRVLVLNALWFGNPHPTHFNVEEAISAAAGIGAERTYLTHLTHRVRHAQLKERLPQGVAAAYDGLTIDI